MKTYQDAVKWAARQLRNIDNPKYEAESLLALILHCNRAHIVAFAERQLSFEEYERYQSIVLKRQKGLPFAYIAGEREFYDLTLKVTEDTLIPRADTEVLVEVALSKMSLEHHYSIVDLGTGSGAIALTVKKHRPNSDVYAVDIIEKTLEVAEENADTLNLDITFVLSRWFELMPDIKFDFILSNPPYIDENDKHLGDDGISFEPQTALVAGNKGYADLFYLIDESRYYLKNHGWLMMEHGFEQGELVRKRMLDQGYAYVETVKDLAGNDRVTIGVFSHT